MACAACHEYTRPGGRQASSHSPPLQPFAAFGKMDIRLVRRVGLARLGASRDGRTGVDAGKGARVARTRIRESITTSGLKG